MYGENQSTITAALVHMEPSPHVRGKRFLTRLNAWSSHKIDLLYVFPYVGWV